MNAIRERLGDEYPETLAADGFDEAIIGIAERAGQQPVVAYDYDKCVEILMAQGMTEEDAVEWMGFNVVGAYVGEYTPVFVHDWRKDAS